MSLTIDALSLQPVAAPIAPPPARQPAVAAVGERDGASNDRRQSAKGGRERGTVAFRSFLNAATLAGLTQTLGAEAPTAGVEEIAPVASPRRSKVPDQKESTLLEADEAEGLYESARTSANPQSSRAREFQAAATRYAKSYFAVTGTYARPGESLELTA